MLNVSSTAATMPGPLQAVYYATKAYVTSFSNALWRELATLKVLGFRNRAIGKLLISQNIWLTVIGVIVGLPAGVGVLEWLLTALAGEYEMKLMLGPLTYCVSILLTFGVSLLVGFMVARKNKKIDMVEALKGAE